MADGSEKRVEEVEAGDQVRACAIESESILNAVVGRVARHRPEEMGDYYLRLNGTLSVTPYHPMYANGEWIPAGGLREGDVLLTIGGSRRVETIEFRGGYTSHTETSRWTYPASNRIILRIIKSCVSAGVIVKNYDFCPTSFLRTCMPIFGPFLLFKDFRLSSEFTILLRARRGRSW
jgi:hypothetical protein